MMPLPSELFLFVMMQDTYFLWPLLAVQLEEDSNSDERGNADKKECCAESYKLCQRGANDS